MNKRILFSIAALCWIALPRPALAEDPGRIIRFDAMTGDFVTYKADQKGNPYVKDTERRPVRWNKRVTLRAIRVNTIRQRYTLDLKNKDYHTAELPKELAPFLTKVTPLVGQNLAGFTRPMVPANTALPKKLQVAFDNFTNAVGAFFDQPGLSKELVGQADLDGDLSQIAYSAQTNVDIRLQAVDRLNQYFTATGIDLKLGAPSGVGQILDDGPKDYSEEELRVLQTTALRIPEPLHKESGSQSKALEGVRAAYLAWQGAFIQWSGQQISMPDPEPVTTLVKSADAFVNKTMGTVDDVSKKRGEAVAELEKHLNRAVTVFTTCVDPLSTPRYLEKTITASKDEVLISVAVETKALADVQKQLFTQASSGGGTGSRLGCGGEDDDGKKDGDNSSGGGAENNLAVKTHERSFPTYGRWVLDFGTGLAATTLRNPRFYLESVRDSSNTVTKRLVRRGVKDSVDLGPAVMGHYYQTSASKLAFGPSFGVMPSTDNFRYLAGLSLVYGDKSRIAITAGAAFGKVSRLNGDVPGQQPNGDAVSTSDVMRAGQFISGTFTFSF